MARRSDLAMALNAARSERKLTIAAAARLIGVNRHTIENWERGVTVPTLAMLLPIATAYQIDRAELVHMRHRAARTRRRRLTPTPEAST